LGSGGLRLRKLNHDEARAALGAKSNSKIILLVSTVLP
jgi:hypothetical protein